MVFIRKSVSRGYTYAQLVVTKRVGKKVIHKVIKHLGPWNRLAEKLTQTTPDDFNQFLSYYYGDINVLFKLSKELNLTQIINNNTIKSGGIKVGDLSLIIITNHCVDPTSKLQIGKWFSRTYLPKLLNLSADKINKDSLIRVLDYLTDERIKKIDS